MHDLQHRYLPLLRRSTKSPGKTPCSPKYAKHTPKFPAAPRHSPPHRARPFGSPIATPPQISSCPSVGDALALDDVTREPARLFLDRRGILHGAALKGHLLLLQVAGGTCLKWNGAGGVSADAGCTGTTAVSCDAQSGCVYRSVVIKDLGMLSMRHHPPTMHTDAVCHPQVHACRCLRPRSAIRPWRRASSKTTPCGEAEMGHTRAAREHAVHTPLPLHQLPTTHLPNYTTDLS